MKKSVFINFSLILTSLSLFASTQSGTNETICFKKNTNGNAVVEKAAVTASTGAWPIMIRMERNAVLRTAITPLSGNVFDKTSMTIELSQEGVLSNIDHISIWKTTASESENGQYRIGDLSDATYYALNTEKIIRVSEDIRPTSTTVTLPFNDGIIISDSNIFYISVKLKENADLDQKIGIKLTKVTFNNKTEVVPTGTTSTIQRIGYAIAIPNDSIKGSLIGNETSGWFRIPGIAKANDNTIVSVFDIRYDSRDDLSSKTNIDIGCSRSTNGGKTWSNINVAAKWNPNNATSYDKASVYGLSDPCLLVDENTGVIFIAALGGKGLAASAFGADVTNNSVGHYVITKSYDNGITWNSPVSINPQVRFQKWKSFFQGPGHGITIKKGVHAGTLVFPSQIWGYNTSYGRDCYSSMIYSTDHGTTWVCEDKNNGTFGIGSAKSPYSKVSSECCIAQLADGSLMINAKNDGSGSCKRVVYTTDDLGANWTEHPSNLTMYAANCQGSLLAVENSGDLNRALLYSGPNSDTMIRKNLTLQVSYDDGNEWRTDKAIVYDTRSIAGYSDMCNIGDGHIGIIYEGVSDSRYLFFLRIGIDEFTPQLSLNKTAEKFHKKGTDNGTIQIASDDTWTVVSDAEWLIPNTTNGTGNETVEFTILPNKTKKSRTATLTVSVGLAVVKKLTVTQSGFGML